MTRLVLIGDSIRRRYQAEVARRLALHGVEVRGPDENCGTSRDILENLERWIWNQDPDLVHVNCGLHDLRIGRESQAPQVSIVDYEHNVEQILRALIERDVSVIWATCTPIVESRHNASRHSRRFEADVRAYNSAATRVAKQLGVRINDLFEAVDDSGSGLLLSPDGVHFTAAGYRFLAERVTRAVTAALDP